MSDTCFLANTTHGNPPRVPFCAIKDEVLGKQYELSVVFVGDTRSRTLNLAHLKKDKPASVLSFPLEKGVGEIYLCLPLLKRRKKRYGDSYRDSVAHHFIHGLLHLKGMEHGSTMETREKQLCKKYGYAHPYH